MTATLERIAVTGVGLVSALGLDARETFRRLMAGERGFSQVRLFDARDQRTGIVGQIQRLQVEDVAFGPQAPSWSRSDAMGVLAARNAVSQSGSMAPGERWAAVVGATNGGMYEAEAVLRSSRRGQLADQALERLLSYPLSVAVRRIAEVFPGMSRTATVCCACSSGAAAIIQGATWLEQGLVDRVLAGGVDGLSQLTMTGFNALGATAPDACRPFDVSRAGLTLGEGAAFLVLETESAARQRGATVLAWLAGWALGAEAHHLTHPEPSGATAAALMRSALQRAGLRPDEVDYVNAHGTGTTHNDAMEARALREVFGPSVGRVFVSSSKGQIGHTLGAAGAVEAAITVLAVSEGAVPPTGGLETPDPELMLRHVLDCGCRATVRAALSNSFGFGGTGSVLAFVRSSDPDRRPPRHRTRPVVTAVAAIGPEGLDRGAELLRYVSPEEHPPSGWALKDPIAELDPARSRRFDRAAAFVTLGVQAVLADAGLESTNVGLAAGSAFGNVGRSIDFMERVANKGPKFANPAEFPHLLPSSASGNASIYLGLKGPVVSVAELDTSAEAAVVIACDWIRSGLVDAVVGGSAEPYDEFVSSVLIPLCGRPDSSRRSEGAAWLMLESEASARSRGADILAVVLSQGQCLPAAQGPLLGLASPRDEGRALVLCSGDHDTCGALLDTSAWARVQRRSVAVAIGTHEGVGGFALAAAAALTGQGIADEVLVLACGADQIHWSLLGRPTGTPVASKGH